MPPHNESTGGGIVGMVLGHRRQAAGSASAPLALELLLGGEAVLLHKLQGTSTPGATSTAISGRSL